MVRGLHGSSKHGWVSGDVAEMIVIRKLASLLDVSGGTAHLFKSSFDVSFWSGSDHADLGFIVDPNHKLLIVVCKESLTLVAKMLSSTGGKGFILFH